MFTRGLNLGPNVESILMILLDCQNKMPDYLIKRPFCSDDFIRSWKAGDH